MKKLTFIWLIASVLCVGMITTSCSSDDDPKVENPDDKDDDDKDDDDKDNDDDDDDAKSSLQGSNYYVVLLDEISYATIGNKVVKDFRPDDVNNFLYIWNGYVGDETVSGPNYYGEIQGWTAVITTGEWTGAGVFVTGGYDLSVLDDSYVFHIALRSKMDQEHVIKFYPTAGGEVSYTVNFPRDGEWHGISIPMSELMDKGVRYTGLQAGDDGAGDNVIAFVSPDAPAGKTLEIDACFFYKPKK